jgi:hypothetical protein
MQPELRHAPTMPGTRPRKVTPAVAMNSPKGRPVGLPSNTPSAAPLASQESH